MRIRLIKPGQQCAEEKEIPQVDDSQLELAVESWVKEFRLLKSANVRRELLAVHNQELKITSTN